MLQLLKEEKSVAELASEHGIHPTQLHKWRKAALENLSELFADDQGGKTMKAQYEKQIEQLYTEIGQLTTQLSWLGKKGIRPE